MHAFRALRSVRAPLVAASAGLWASSNRLESKPIAAESAVKRQDSKPPRDGSGDGEGASPPGDGDKKAPYPPPIGPMVAVYLDQESVNTLKARYPEAREGQLRKVVLQYGPSESERLMYQHLFSGRAEVTVTGEASSFGRRALVASVSNAGRIIEPTSLSSTIDISPAPDTEDAAASERDGPGPLASAALIEQVKQAGATKEESWRGTLPPLLAHHRQFPSEDGAYTRLKKPITVNGTICRADWVDGASTRCRDTLEGGVKREEDWTPSSCSICAVFEVSPCKDIFISRFVAASKRYDAHLEAVEPLQEEGEGVDEERRKDVREERGDEEERPPEGVQGEGSPDGPSAEARVVNTRENRTAMTEGQEKVSQKDDQEAASGVSRGGRVSEGGDEDERRQAEKDLVREKLQADVHSAVAELRECMTFHDM